MNLQSYFGHLFCEQLSIAISFSHYIFHYCPHHQIPTVFVYFLVCLEMHFVGNGDCIEHDILALSYHLFAEECDF